MENTNEGTYESVEAEVVHGNDQLGLEKSGRALSDNVEEWSHPLVDDVIDTQGEEVYDSTTAGVGGSDVSVPDNAPFPLQITPEELLKALGSEDPGRFVDSLGQSGLMVGRIVSLSLRTLKGAAFERAMVAAVEPDGVTVSYLNKETKKWPFEKIKNIEILHKGQRIATHELQYPMYGVSREKMLPYLRELTSGKETHVKTVKEDGAELNAKLCVYRSREEDKKGRAQMYSIYGAEELVIKDIPKLGIFFNETQKAELLDKGFLSKPYEAKINVDGKDEVVHYRINVDKELNVIRTARVKMKLQQSQLANLSTSSIIDLVKYLQKNGFKNAFVDVKSPEKLAEGIQLNRGAGVSAHLVLKEKQGKNVPELKIVWKAGDDQGIGKAAYTDQFKLAAGKAVEFLDALANKKEAKLEEKVEKPEGIAKGNIEKQEVKKSPGLKVS